jgi:hypothetical protein
LAPFSTSTFTFNFNFNTHEPYMILKALNVLYKSVLVTLLSTLHGSGAIRLFLKSFFKKLKKINVSAKTG